MLSLLIDTSPGVIVNRLEAELGYGNYARCGWRVDHVQQESPRI